MSPRTFNERASTDFGRRGVLAVVDALRAHPSIECVVDADDDLAAQAEGWDLLVRQRGQAACCRVEVKTDRHRPLNIALELVSNVERGVPGCLITSQADFWVYVFARTGDVIRFSPSEVRKWLEAHSGRFETFEAKTWVGRTRYTTRGLLVPVGVLLNEVRGTRRLPLDVSSLRADARVGGGADRPSRSSISASRAQV